MGGTRPVRAVREHYTPNVLLLCSAGVAELFYIYPVFFIERQQRRGTMVTSIERPCSGMGGKAGRGVIAGVESLALVVMPRKCDFRINLMNMSCLLYTSPSPRDS